MKTRTNGRETRKALVARANKWRSGIIKNLSGGFYVAGLTEIANSQQSLGFSLSDLQFHADKVNERLTGVMGAIERVCARVHKIGHWTPNLTARKRELDSVRDGLRYAADKLAEEIMHRQQMAEVVHMTASKPVAVVEADRPPLKALKAMKPGRKAKRRTPDTRIKLSGFGELAEYLENTKIAHKAA